MKNQKGFTLIESLLALIITAIVIGGAVGAFVAVQKKAYIGIKNPQTGAQHTVKITINGAQWGDVKSDTAVNVCKASCTLDINKPSVTLNADPEDNFYEWGGSCSGKNPECTFTLPSDRSTITEVTATFLEPPVIGPYPNLNLVFDGILQKFTGVNVTSPEDITAINFTIGANDPSLANGVQIIIRNFFNISVPIVEGIIPIPGHYYSTICSGGPTTDYYFRINAIAYGNPPNEIWSSTATSIIGPVSPCIVI